MRIKHLDKKVTPKAKLKASHTVKKVTHSADTQRRIKDLQALNKKTHASTPAGKKAVAKKAASTAAQQAAAKKKLAIAAQQTSKVGKKVATKSGGTLLKTAKSVGGKAALAAAGAGAAYGGYKLYKRHFSKAAKACKGKAGAERTLCLQQQTRQT